MNTNIQLSSLTIIKQIIFGLIFSYSILYQVSYAAITVTPIEYTNVITNKVFGNTIQHKDVYTHLSILCNTLLGEQEDAIPKLSIVNSSDSISMQYNARESIFVTVVCNSLIDSKNTKKAEISSYHVNTMLKDRKNFRKLGIACPSQQSPQNPISNNDCEQRTYDNKFDYAFAFEKIITKVLNDRFNMGLSRLYGSIDKEDEDNKNLANTFIANHFNTIGKVYEQKNYPSTQKTLINYIKNARNIQKSAFFIDYKKINPDGVQDFPLWKDFRFVTNNGLPKTYHESTINIVYNELFYYKLFSTIYSILIQHYRTDTTQLPQSLQYLQYTPQQAKDIQIQRLQDQIIRMNNASNQTIRQLGNLESAFPLHIGMIMYYEDLISLRSNLADLYLPLHQLHFKLQNVQSKM